MTFQELELLVAIQGVPHLGRDRVTHQERLDFAKRVHGEWCLRTGDVLFPFTVDDVHRLAMSLRKNRSTRTKAEIAAAHGTACFWRHRGKGPCSDEAEAGHVVARCEGAELTVANGMIECRAHNNQRRDMTIEEYLLSNQNATKGVDCASTI